jgi:elongation factor G
VGNTVLPVKNSRRIEFTGVIKVADITKIRNVALVGHGDSGKTSIGEAMIYNIGDTTRLGDIEAGNTVLDYQDEEIARKITISSSFYPIPWKNAEVSLVDTPGYADFILEAKSSLRGVDGAVVVVDAMSGVEVGTMKAFGYAVELNLPRLIFINKLDRDNVDFDTAVESVKEAFGRPTILTIPIGLSAQLEGVIDLLTGTAWKFPGDGKKPEKTDIPADLADEVATYKQELIESIAETDESLMEKFFADEELTEAELYGALKKAVAAGDVVPVFCGSATKNIGIHNLLDGIVNLLPSPADRPPAVGHGIDSEEEITREPGLDAPFSAFCFKTIVDPFAGRLNIIRVLSGKVTGDTNLYNSSLERKEKSSGLLKIKGKDTIGVKELHAGEIGAFVKMEETRTGHTVCEQAKAIVYPEIYYPQPVYWVAIEPASRDDEQKLSQGLQRISEEDPSFRYERNAETKELVISSMGQAHLKVLLEKLKNKFGVDVNQRPPTIAYRETIKGKAEVQGKHKKQTGGAGQFGECWLRLEPAERGTGFQFVDEIFGGSIPRQFIPAVEKGVVETMEDGVIAGYKVVDVRVTVYDGKHHPVDSKEVAFKAAARKGFKAGFVQAQPILMEPIYTLETNVPSEYLGDIMGDLSSKRGRILGTDTQGKNSIIKATIPLQELQTYSADLNSMTGGRGTFEIEFSHYEEVPGDLQQRIIDARKGILKEDED